MASAAPSASGHWEPGLGNSPLEILSKTSQPPRFGVFLHSFDSLRQVDFWLGTAFE